MTEAACEICPCRDHCVNTDYCGTLSLVFQRPPIHPIVLGQTFSQDSEVLGIVVAVRLLENGSLFVKLKVQDPDRTGAYALKAGVEVPA